MTIYVVSDFNFHPGTETWLRHHISAFKMHCTVVDNVGFKRLVASCAVSYDNDTVISVFSGDNSIITAVAPKNRYYFINDESSTPDGIGYARQIKHMNNVGCIHAIVTYANKGHLQCLIDAGISYIYMPIVCPAIRQRVHKDIAVVGIGNFEVPTYKTRAHIAAVLRDVPGFKLVSCTSVDTYKKMRDDVYLDGLDHAELGIVCRVGYRDRMVPKYIEFGACHVLPIGDCPTYMPDEMKRIMINTDGMTDERILLETNRLLSGDRVELHRRQDRYSALCHSYFDMSTIGDNVYNALSLPI